MKISTASLDRHSFLHIISICCSEIKHLNKQTPIKKNGTQAAKKKNKTKYMIEAMKQSPRSKLFLSNDQMRKRLKNKINTIFFYIYELVKLLSLIVEEAYMFNHY